MPKRQRQQPVPRPLNRAEYELRHATREAEKDWTDLLATARNAAVEAWDFRTKTPLNRSERCHPLKGDVATVRIQDVTMRVTTGHPNETVKRFR